MRRRQQRQTQLLSVGLRRRLTLVFVDCDRHARAATVGGGDRRRTSLDYKQTSTRRRLSDERCSHGRSQEAACAQLSVSTCLDCGFTEKVCH